MIYCITQPLDKYSVDFGAVAIGPWADMGKDPIVFSMVSFFTPLLYQWEEGSPVPLMARNVDVTPDVTAQLLATAKRQLPSGLSFSAVLDMAGSPFGLAEALITTKFWEAKLPLYGTYTREQLEMVFHARVLSWMRTHVHPKLTEWDKLYAEDEQFVKEHAYGSHKVC